MKEFAPLLHGYWYMFRGAGMTVLMAGVAVLPATLCGIVLALAQVFGITVMRLSDAAVLPYRYSHYAHKISDFLDDASAWAVDDDGRQTVKLDLESSKTLAAEIATRSTALEKQIDENVESGRWPDASTAALNDRLTHLEQDLLDESGSPAEHWYRHVIYGWNIYSLYDGQPLPGLAEAIRLKDPIDIRPLAAPQYR